MKRTTLFLLVLLCLNNLSTISAQEAFNNCTAAFLNNKMIVDEYTTTGKCKLPLNATGTLTVCTAELSPEKSVAKDQVKFMVAIRDHNTGTLMMYSTKVYRQVDISEIAQKCKAGDKIVVMTINNEYAVPHNEILLY